MNPRDHSHPDVSIGQRAHQFFAIHPQDHSERMTPRDTEISYNQTTLLISSQPPQTPSPHLSPLSSLSQPSSPRLPLRTNSTVATTEPPVTTYPSLLDEVNSATVEPGRVDITDSSSTPPGSAPHPSANSGNNHRSQGSLNSAITAAKTSTKATSRSTKPRFEQDTTQLQQLESKMINILKSGIRTFTSFADENEQLSREQQSQIEVLEMEVSKLKRHCDKLASKHDEVLNRLRMEQSHVTQLNRDIAKLSLAQGTKDDRYFTSKFTEIFLSIHDWVLQRFTGTNFEQLSTGLRSEPVSKRLRQYFPVHYANVLSEHPLYLIEALVGYIIDQALFVTPFPQCKIQRFIQDSSASNEERTHWRMQTTRIILSSTSFRSYLDRCLDDIGDEIDNALAPIVEASPKTGKRLRGIIQSAANLAMDCQQQPSKFSMCWFNPGDKCDEEEMSEVLGEIADNKLASGGAFVGQTVSPMVFRDSGTILVKARVLRQLPLEEEL